MTQYEDWNTPVGARFYDHLRSYQIDSAPSIKLLEDREIIAYELVYQTIVDCYKVATSQWKHFKCMRWHAYDDYERTLATAREHVEKWIESEAFALEVKLIGWEPEVALKRLREVLTGKHNHEIKPLLVEISRQRDARRNREINLDG